MITFTQSGSFHLATKAIPKKILRVPVPKQLNAARVSAEFDVVAGPWNPRLKKGAHNLIFFHRGRFRSNTLANVNAFGPSNNNFKSAQNLDLPAKLQHQRQGRVRVPAGADLSRQPPLQRDGQQGHLRHLPGRQAGEGRAV